MASPPERLQCVSSGAGALYALPYLMPSALV